MCLIYHNIILLDYKKVYNYNNIIDIATITHPLYVRLSDTQSRSSEPVVHKISSSHTKGSMF